MSLGQEACGGRERSPWTSELVPKFQNSELQIFDAEDLHHGKAPMPLRERDDLVLNAWGEILATWTDPATTPPPSAVWCTDWL